MGIFNHGMSKKTATLVLSMDYELFFGDSGSVEKCLLEPTSEILNFASRLGCKITFFVDAGMLLKMDEYSSRDSRLHRELEAIKRNIESIATQGHEIGLHVHPHWADSTWTGSAWDFANTRYSLREFSETEISQIISSQAEALMDVSGTQPTSYRAGGFCFQPFSKIAPALQDAGITIDSSVVPGMSLRGARKGFDFSSAPDLDRWRFDVDPLVPTKGGSFVEIPVSAVRLPLFYYWARLAARAAGRSVARSFGDGKSVGISRYEAVRRLFGGRSLSELSVDAAKAPILGTKLTSMNDSEYWHIMGHPKLVSRQSLGYLRTFVENNRIDAFSTVRSAALDQ